MNCFGGLSNRFASEVCPMFYRNSVVCFQEQIAFFSENRLFYSHIVLGMCEGVGEDSGHGIGYVDIRVGLCNCLNVFVLPCMCT